MWSSLVLAFIKTLRRFIKLEEARVQCCSHLQGTALSSLTMDCQQWENSPGCTGTRKGLQRVGCTVTRRQGDHNWILEQTSAWWRITWVCENMEWWFIVLYAVTDQETSSFLTGNRIRKWQQGRKSHGAEGITKGPSDGMGMCGVRVEAGLALHFNSFHGDQAPEGVKSVVSRGMWSRACENLEQSSQ